MRRFWHFEGRAERHCSPDGWTAAAEWPEGSAQQACGAGREVGCVLCDFTEGALGVNPAIWH